MMEPTSSNGAPPPARSGLPGWVIPVAIIIGLILLVPLLLRSVGSAITGGRRDPEAQRIRAEGAKARAESQAEARGERQERKDFRLARRALRKELRACKRATRGVKRRGGARRRAKAACQEKFRRDLEKLRADALSAGREAEVEGESGEDA